MCHFFRIFDENSARMNNNCPVTPLYPIINTYQLNAHYPNWLRPKIVRTYEYLVTHLAAIDYIRVNCGYSVRAFANLCQNNGIYLSWRYYYNLFPQRCDGLVRRTSCGWMIISLVAELLHVSEHDLYCLGCRIRAGETPDLSEYGYTPERLEAERAKRKLERKVAYQLRDHVRK